MRLNLKMKLSLINSIIIIMVIISVLLLSIAIANSTVSIMGNKITKEIEQNLEEKLKKSVQISLKIINDKAENVKRDGELMAHSDMVGALLMEEAVEKTAIMKDSHSGELIKKYTKVEIDKKSSDLYFLKVVNSLQQNIYFGRDALQSIEIVDKNGDIRGENSRLQEEFKEKNKSEKIKNSLESESDMIDIVAGEGGIAIKTYSVSKKYMRSKNKGLIILTLPMNIIFANNMKNITDTEIVFYTKQNFLTGTFFRVNNSEMVKLQNEEEVFNKILKGEKIIIRDKEINFGEIDGKSIKEKYKFAFAPIKNYKDEIIGMIAVAATTKDIEKAMINSEEKRLEIIRKLIFNFIAVSVILLIIGMIFIYLYAGNMTKPLLKILEILKKVSKGDLTAKVEVKQSDEIGELGNGINDMIDGLKHIDKMKDEFLANTSHELRTPLNGIIGLSESILEAVNCKMGEKEREYLGMIISSGRRLSKLVDDILDFARLKEKDMVLNKKSLNLKKIVDIVAGINRPSAEKKRVKIVNSVSEKFPHIFGDENRIEQILNNLIGNAIKFTKDGYVEISSELTGDKKQALIKVKDNGIGIPKDKYKVIFNSFEQVDGSTAREYGGTGLGLAITRKIVEIHNGKIWVESEVGKGAEFLFTMPLSNKEEEENENFTVTELSDENVTECKMATDEEEKIKKDKNIVTKILIADDEPINIEVVKNMIANEEYQIDIALNGEETVNKIKSAAKNGIFYDLLILDIMMPKKTGYEVCRELRNEFSAVELPILMLTAKNSPTDIEEGFDSGANDYLTKPIEKKEIYARVNTLLNLKKAVFTSLYNVEKYSIEKQHREVAERLREINNELTSVIKSEKVIEKLFEITKEILQYESAKAYIYINSDYNLIKYHKTTKNIESYKADLNEYDKEFINEIIEKSMPVFRNEELGEYEIGMPILSGEEILGVVVFSCKDGKSSKYNSDMVFTIVTQAATAIQNARLFEAVEKWTKELEKSNKELEDSLIELKETQNSLIISEKMAVLGGLVAGVAHEINTPVGIGITASSYLINETEKIIEKYKREKMTEEDFEIFLETVQKGNDLIYSSLKRAADLVSSFKQVSVDQNSESKREFNLKKYMSDTIQSLQFKLKQKHHEVEVIVDENLVVDSYPGAYYQIFTNLIINSIIHGFEERENGKILINIVKENDKLKIVYKDNGKGMKEEIINKIFDPFFTTKRGSGGSGLGMHIVYNIVTQKLFGTIKCNSKEGEWSKFEIEIPI